MAKFVDPQVQEALDNQSIKLAAQHEKVIAKLTKDHEKALVTQKKELIATAKNLPLSVDEGADKAVVAAVKVHHKNVLAALAAHGTSAA